MNDWNWFFSTIAQTTGGIIAILFAFNINRIYDLFSFRDNYTEKKYEFNIESDHIFSNIKEILEQIKFDVFYRFFSEKLSFILKEKNYKKELPENINIDQIADVFGESIEKLFENREEMNIAIINNIIKLMSKNIVNDIKFVDFINVINRLTPSQRSFNWEYKFIETNGFIPEINTYILDCIDEIDKKEKEAKKCLNKIEKSIENVKIIRIITTFSLIALVIFIIPPISLLPIDENLIFVWKFENNIVNCIKYLYIVLFWLITIVLSFWAYKKYDLLKNELNEIKKFYTEKFEFCKKLKEKCINYKKVINDIR